MSVQITVQPINPFDPHGDAATTYQRWQRWVRGFELFADATGCTDDKQKRQLLLHSAGTDVQDIFFTLSETPAKYPEAKAALDTHFKPISNVTYQRHVFRQAKQQEGETIQCFVTRLRQLAKDCDFGDKQDEFITDQVIDKCASSHLRTKLLTQQKLTLKKCLEIAAAKEVSEIQANDIAGGEKVFWTKTGVAGAKTGVASASTKQQSRFKPRKHGYKSRGTSENHKQSQDSTVQCSRCGGKGHTGNECICSRNIVCWKCENIGHFANMCRSKPAGKKHFKKRSVQFVSEHKTYTADTPTHRQENTEHATHESGSDSDEYVFAMMPDDTRKILIEEEPVHMVIDSGASCNIINSKIASKLREQGLELQNCKRVIHPYNSPPIVVRKCVSASVQTAGNNSPQITTEFLVIPGTAPPLLGKATAEALGLLHINVNSVREDPIFDQYPGICNGIGKLRDFEVGLHIDPTVSPVARKHSRVPFHLREQVRKELDRLEEQDIIEKVTGPTEWVSRIVAVPKPKNKNEIRICVDMREANRAIQRTRHVTPTIEDLTNDMKDATVFSTIDLKAGYHQLVLKKESRHITTFSAHCGLYRYKRLSFGINSAAEVFQHTIQTVIEGITGAKNVSDDIIVFGRDRQDHDRALHETLKRLHSAGLTVNRDKCVLHQSQVKFYGFVFSSEGLKPDPSKVKALQEAATPTNAAELRSYLGMAQYSSRFIEDFSTITEPLRRLTKQDATWSWQEEQETAFQRMKTALSANCTLAYFDINKKTDILVDASPVGIAGLLSQSGKPVCYASRALTPVEQKYSQTEREALAVVWACEHFNVYVSGSSFTVYTDHRPLLTIWDKPFPPMRIARWALRLQPYSFKMEYRPGKENPADYMSRHPSTTTQIASREEIIAEEFVNFTSESSTPCAMTLDDVKEATASDNTLITIIEMVRTGRWHDSHNLNPDTYVCYRNVKESLCVNAEQNILLKDAQIVIPQSLQKRVIELAHEGHQGINKTKALLRSKVWFPRMNDAVETAVNSCIPCQANSSRRNHEPLNMSELPKGPWLDLSMDFCGPLPSGESLLVITDEYSRYPVIEIVRNTSTESIIPVVDKMFSLFGYPKVVKSDNGPQFRSALWKSFMTSCGIKHRRITPLWPKANAQAETFNKPMLKAIRSAHIQHRSWKQELYKFCRVYRTTPHCTTQFTPHFLLFGREPRTKLPELSTQTHHADAEVRVRDQAAKLKMKQYADHRNSAKHYEMLPGDCVLIKQHKQNKLSTSFDPTPLYVTDVKQSMVTAQRPDGSTVTRNSSLFRRVPRSIHPNPVPESLIRDPVISTPGTSSMEEDETRVPARVPICVPESVPGCVPEGVPRCVPGRVPEGVPRCVPDVDPGVPVRRSQRHSRPPKYLDDFVK